MTQSVRAIRNAGYVACLVGVLMMVLGRFRAGAPSSIIYVGLAVIVFGWGFLVFSMVRAATEARALRKGHGSGFKG